MREKWQRDTVKFIGSQTVSMFGSLLVQYAISWYITLKTQSGAMMTVSIICAMIPTFLISPFAGVWADRFDRKKLMMIADSSIALTTLIVAIFFFAGFREYWLLFVALVIRALGAGIQSPAASAFLPSLVPEDRLMRVNGIFGSVQSLMMLVAPMVSAALLTFARIEYIFFIDVITAAIAVGILLVFLKVPARVRPKAAEGLGYYEDLRDGVRYIARHPFVKRFFVILALYFFLCAPAAFLTPLQVTRNYGSEVWRLTAIEVFFSLGMMVGGVLVGTWGGFKNRVHTMILSCAVIGLCTIALGFVPWFAPYLGIMSLFGICMPFLGTPAMVLLQETIEDDFRGRVFSVMNMINTVMMPLGMIVFGPIADALRIEYLLIGCGIGLSCVAVMMLLSRTLVRAGRPVPAPQVGAAT